MERLTAAVPAYLKGKQLSLFCPGAVGDHGLVPHIGIQVSKKKKITLSRNNSVLWGSIRDQKDRYSASDRQNSSFNFCVSKEVSSHSSHHPQGVLLTQFSLEVHKVGLKLHSFNFFVHMGVFCETQ